ncbi:DUF397 domain-containing protein [Nonomuraea sp. NPDC050643]|uniref:DUF397 domain-containing protein n=1 Tax=Nonomuraea sp. NPDC050643 TaxID=3155660 RepID=UPI0033D1D41B
MNRPVSSSCRLKVSRAEVATLANGTVGVRDSKDPHGPVLEFSFEEWDCLLGTMKSRIH